MRLGTLARIAIKECHINAQPTPSLIRRSVLIGSTAFVATIVVLFLVYKFVL